MNVAIVIENLSPAQGGAESQGAELVRWLLGASHGVSVVARSWASEFEAGLTAAGAEASFHRIAREPGPRAWRAYQFALRSAARVRELRREGRIDVALDLGWGALCDVVLTNVYLDNRRARARSIRNRLVREFVGAQQLMAPHEWLKLRLQRLRFGRRPPPDAIALSREMARRFHELYGLPQERLHVSPVGIDPRRFTEARLQPLREPTRSELGVNGELLAITIGHNYRLKGVGTVLRVARRAARRLPIRFLVVGGEARLAESYQRRAHRMGCDNIRFLPATPHVERYYAAGDVVLLPTFYDSCSLVVLEGMAAGLPPLTSREAGASELIDRGRTGFVAADPGDEAQFEDWLVELLDEDRRRSIGTAARAAAQQYTSEAHYRTVTSVLEGAASRGGG
jgi:UDP-glucose:(heptosyl)LPS alpha-1,3-glucosyltransferase